MNRPLIPVRQLDIARLLRVADFPTLNLVNFINFVRNGDAKLNETGRSSGRQNSVNTVNPCTRPAVN